MSTEYTRYQQYLDKLQRPHIAATKIEWLNDDGSVAFDITEDAIQSGTLNVQYQSGIRATADILLDNWAQTYDINADKIWFGQQIKIYKGLYLDDGSPYYIPKGVFYVSNPDQVYSPSQRTTHLSLVDKWGYLDGTLFGHLDGIYQLNIGDDLLVALREILRKDRGNGIPYDSMAPMLSSYYIGRKDTVQRTKAVTNIDSQGNQYTTTIVETEQVPVIECPYTARIEASGTVADVILEIAKMLVANVGYNVDGRLCIEPNNTDANNYDRPVLWNYRTTENALLNISYQFPLSDVYNAITVTGATLNGVQVKGYAENTDARSGTSVRRIGAKHYSESQTSYYSDSQCQEMAQYLLEQKSTLLATTTIDSIPIYHMRENTLVTLERPEVSTAIDTYLVTGYSMPIGQTGSMSISAVQVYGGGK